MKNDFKRRAELILTILKLTGYTMEEYAEAIYKLGAQYAFYYSSNDKVGATALMRTEGYWSWYKNQWLLADLQFVASYGSIAEIIPADLLEGYWHEMHNPKKMKASPDSDVLKDCYTMMVTLKRNKEVTHG